MPEDIGADHAWVKGLLKRNGHQSGSCPRHDHASSAYGLPLDERILRGLIRGRFAEERPSAPQWAGGQVPHRGLPTNLHSRLFPQNLFYLPTLTCPFCVL